MTIPPPVVASLVAAFDRRDPERLRELVKHIHADLLPRPVPAFWHPLGFFRLPMAQDDQNRRYVLHCWPRGERHTQDPAWLIHSHAWALESVVLSGEIRDRQYRWRQTADPILRGQLYLAGSGAAHTSTLVRSDRVVLLDDESDQNVDAGGFYDVPMQCFHQSEIAPTGHCVTLVRIGGRVRSNSLVVGEFAAPAKLVYYSEQTDPYLVRRYVDIL